MTDPTYWNEYDSGPKPPSLSEVFLRAAQFVNDGYAMSCCNALDYATTPADWRTRFWARQQLIKWFKPPHKAPYDFWWDFYDRQSRVLALCFLAAITESPKC